MRTLRFDRASRLLFALVSAWCLVCRSFQPVIERALEDFGESRPSPLSFLSGDSTNNDEPSSEVEVLNGHTSFDCVAVHPTVVVVVVTPGAPISAFDSPPVGLASVDRKPLVPPPIARALA